MSSVEALPVVTDEGSVGLVETKIVTLFEPPRPLRTAGGLAAGEHGPRRSSQEERSVNDEPCQMTS